MKILVISQYYYPEQFRINEICEELASKGNEVTVLAGIPNYPEGEIFPGYEKSYKKIETLNGVKIIRCNNKPRHKGIVNLAINYASYVVCANRIIKKLNEKFDVVYVYELSPITMAIPAIKIKRIRKLPMYLYCLDLWPESAKEYSTGKILSEHNIIYKFIKLLSSKIYQKADMIGVTSPSFKKYLSDVCKVDKQKIHYLPQHSDDVAKDNNLQKRSSKNVNIFYMGNVGISQNVDQIVDAVYMIRNVENFKVHVVGAGSELENMMRNVSIKGLDDKFVFYGKRPYSDMYKFYREADGCLLTLNAKTRVGNTIPGKLQNYMSAGKPIIAAINGDASDVIKQANCGICVQADDSEKLSQAFLKFINDKHMYEIWGNNARKYYEDNFQLDKHIEVLEENLHKICND